MQLLNSATNNFLWKSAMSLFLLYFLFIYLFYFFEFTYVTLFSYYFIKFYCYDRSVVKQ